jgi:PilZ domain
MSVSSRHGGDAPAANAGDRRVHERHEITPRLYVILDGPCGGAILNDVSEGGAALDIVGSQPEGEYVAVDFEMSELGQQFEAKGRISWRDEAGKRFGVHFVDLPESSRNQIREWLSIKSTLLHPVQSAIVQDAEREGPAMPQSMPEAAPTELWRLEETGARDAGPFRERQGESVSERDVEIALEPQMQTISDASTSDSSNGRLVQSLLDSFNKPQKKPKFVNSISAGRRFFSGWPIRRWILAGSALCLAVLLAFGVAAHRSPERSGTPSISKAGERPYNVASTQPEGGANGTTNSNGGGAGNANDGGYSRGGAGNAPPNSRFPTPALLSSLAASLPKGSRPPCVNLGPAGDKIRIYLWKERDTPDAIIATYSKYLKAVSDIRVVDKAPYDLVLYVNGANVGAAGLEPAYVWTSRIFRPWYCGQTLGLLEQPEVNESLHYVRDANLDQRIQAEVAYLILHTLESIRNEQTK